MFGKTSYCKPLCYCILFTLISTMALAQEEIPELIDTADTHHEQELIERYRLKTSSFLEQAKSKYSRKIYSPLKEQYKEHSDIFIEKITDNEFLFDARIDSFLHKTYHQLTSSKHYHTDVELLVSKHRTLNAFMSPDDFLVLHIGSFYYTDNEGQLVSIMAHELAHCLLEHAEQSWTNRISSKASKDMKRERGKIMRQKYSQRSSLVELLKGDLYDHRKLSRKQEYEADSLGYQILTEAGYDGTDYIKMLELSLRYDTIKPKELNPEVYSNYFDLPGQAFKPQWLKQENFSEYKYVAKGAANLSDDSVATHPELTDRINHLKSLYPELNNKQQETSVSSKEYQEIQMLAKYEFLPNLYDLEDYGLGVYITLKMLTQETNNDYCFYWLGQFFQKIAQARKDYKLSKYLDIVIPEKQSESYIQFLSFMWNLSYEELLYIADFYTEKNKG